jgi:hypothetical protein
MLERESSRRTRPGRVIVTGLWTAAAIAVVGGFLLRPLARLAGQDLRLLAIAVIGGGLVVAVLAWIGEHLLKSSDRD